LENTDSKKGASADVPVPLSNRFQLQTRDVVLISIVALLVAVWVVVRGNRASEGLLGRPLRVGIVSWPGYAGGLVANNGLRPNKDSDFWNEHKLLVEFVLVEDEDRLLRDFARGGENGGLDVVWSTVDSLAHQFPAFLKEGVRPRALMQVDWSRGGDAIVASAGIGRIEDLRGKTVAVSVAASQWLFEYSLENSSLTDAEKTDIRMKRHPTKGSQEAFEQFVNGSVAAAVLWEPDVSEALKRRAGAHILVDTATAANLIADVMVANEDFIRQYPNVIAAFIEGWLLDGTTKAINNPMLAVRVLQDEPDFYRLGEETTHKLLSKAALATLDDNVEMFGLSGGNALFDRLFDEASHLWLNRGYITDQTAAEQARDTGFLREIYSARRGTSAVGTGCGPEIMTKELAVVFPSGKADLGPEARRVLDDKMSLLLRAYSEARFCVDASADEGDDPQTALGTSRARARAVIEYLVEHHNVPRSRFVPTSGSTPETTSGGKVTQYVRLRLVSTGAIGNELGAH
jgi:NitT/TauT family transport system substrate-binding protein